MIVADRKPLEEILEMVQPYDNVMLVGCKGCVTVCNVGGLKEVQILASTLRIARKKEGRPLAVEEKMLERQCDPEYIELLRDSYDKYDAVLSMACGVGPQFLSEAYPGQRFFPTVNTKFFGGAVTHGIWEERCAGCGTCVIHYYDGLCPHCPLLQKPPARTVRRQRRRQMRNFQGNRVYLGHNRAQENGTGDAWMTSGCTGRPRIGAAPGTAGPRRSIRGGVGKMSDNGYKSGSNLEKVLKAGHFAFTGECGPPKGANVEHLKEKMEPLRGVVDAINVTDNQTAVVRMSSKAASALMVLAGLEPNFQMVCRDRNRIAIAERHPGRPCPGHPQHALPVRRPPAVRQPSGIEKCLRYRQHAVDCAGEENAR